MITTRRIRCAALWIAALVACSGCGENAPRANGSGAASGVTVVTRSVPAGATGVATGAFTTPSHEYPVIALPQTFQHVLTFTMEPMAPPTRSAIRTNGPLIVFSDDLDVVVFSPVDHPFETLVWFADGALHSGLEGELDSIPPGFTHEFLLVRGHGINATMERWGAALRERLGGEIPDRYADAGLASLGYWTDNGAIYYYATAPDRNEADTLLEVKRDADQRGIPFGYFQLDSWWYFKETSATGPFGGLVSWQPQPWMFPEGLTAFRERLGLPLVLHNRWFAPTNDYTSRYEFVRGGGDPDMAFPVARGVFDEFMADAVRWGAVTYEQDWLMAQFWGVPWLRQALGRAETWMANLADAAASAGLTVQLCMPGPAHFLDKPRHPNVTTARVSIDYLAGAPKTMYWPAFHTTSMLAAAVGVWPFKDNFLSASDQRTLFDEHQNEQEALVSALSGGMVGAGDGIGAADAALLRRTCRADGVLLKPDRPATPIDAMFLPHQRPYTVSTFSDRSGLGRWTYLAAYALWRGDDVRRFLDGLFAFIDYGRPLDDLFVLPDELRDWNVDLERDLAIREPMVAYDWRRGSANVVEGAFALEARGKAFDFDYVVLAPILENGLALIGEPEKFVTLADHRFRDVHPIGDGLEIALAGASHERIDLLAFDARAGRLLPPASATLDAHGTGRIVLSR